MPEIVHTRPPNFDDIVKVFPMADLPNVIFSYGHTIYSPSKTKIPIEILKHEFVHCERQGTAEDGIIKWWDKYLKDPQFRYDEEVIAHIAEYKKACEIARNRQHKRMYTHNIAKRLSSPLYGKMVPYGEARRILKNG